jgi:hypothetical protein
MIDTPSTENGLHSGAVLGAITIRNVHGQNHMQSEHSSVANISIIIIAKLIKAIIVHKMDAMEVIQKSSSNYAGV